MGKGKVQKKDNSGKLARIEKNKARKVQKRITEREKNKGTSNKDQKEVSCGCGRTVKIRDYKVKDTYKCCTCRTPKS